MAVSEIGLCSGHSASGGLDQRTRVKRRCQGFTPAGDMASVATQLHAWRLYLREEYVQPARIEYIGASRHAGGSMMAPFQAERQRIMAPIGPTYRHPRPIYIGVQAAPAKLTITFKPPKERESDEGLDWSIFFRAHEELEQLGATDPHDLMRAA